jgi:hypothetical protein
LLEFVDERVTRSSSPPRLRALRARTWSTSTLRIALAATPKKCARLDHSWPLGVSIMRRYASCTSTVGCSVRAAAPRR